MSDTVAAPAETGNSKWLDWIEKVGNKVPNPTIMFVYLIGLVAIISALLSWAGVSVTDEVVTPVPRDEFNQINEQNADVAFAGAALYLLPMLLVYIYFQDDILLGVQLSELK